MDDEWQRVRDALTSAGVDGVGDFGLFVNNTTYFAPSTFDERAAAPVLLDLLPTLDEPRVVAAVGRHLKGQRCVVNGYAIVLAAFERWATEPGETGWVLGDTLARASDKSKAHVLIQLAITDRYGASRGCVVEALWRFKAVADVEQPLRRLVADPDVSLVAMSALQRTIGAEATNDVLEQLLESSPDPTVQRHAQRQLNRIRTKLTRPANET